MKKIAIITGAGGGLGKEFTRLLAAEGLFEIWCIARNEAKLEALKSEYGEDIIPMPLDLNDPQSITALSDKLDERQATVSYLINNAGVGEKLGSYAEYTPEQISSLITVNCTSVVSLCTVCIPHMERGGKILNVASQSAFQPVPYLNLYASSKAFVRNYTRALNVELKSSGITATAVCPGWVDTEMLPEEINGEKVRYPGMAKGSEVALKALNDAKKGKDSSVFSLYVKYMHLLSKLSPQKSTMRVWMASIKKYLK